MSLIPKNLITPLAIGAVALSLLAYVIDPKKENPSLDERPMKARRLPGFTIAVPEGGNEPQPNLDYVAGKLELDYGTGDSPLIKVGWQYGKVADEAGLLVIGRAMAKGMGQNADSVRVIATPSRNMIVLSGGLMSFVQCGMRTITIGSYRVDQPTHMRIVDSLVCHPDPQQEDGAAAIPLAIDLPGYVATGRLPGQLVLEGMMGRVVLARRMTDPAKFDLRGPIGDALLTALGLQGTFGPPHGDIETFTATFEDGEQPGRLRFVTCSRANILVAAIAVDVATIDFLEKRIAAAHCLAPGEAAPTWPDAPIDDDDLHDGLHDDSGSAQP